MKTKKYVDKIHIEENVIPVYDKLKADKNPIFICGAGSLAIHVYRYCKKFGITIQGCFITAVEKQGDFQDLPLFTLRELLNYCSAFSVIIGFSDYEYGLKYLGEIKNIKNIYCISALCSGINHLIQYSYIKDEEERIEDMFIGSRDILSKQCLQSYYEARINDSPHYIFPYYNKKYTYYLNDIFSLTHDELLLDIGACVGNAIWPFVEAVQGSYRGIIAVEPDEENFTILQMNVKCRGLDRIILRKQCIDGKNGYACFKGEGEYSGICEAQEADKRYRTITVDSLCKELNVETSLSIIKINFPFSVPEILQGASSVLKHKRPKLIIRAGFDEKVLLNTYEMIKRLNQQYEIYFRYTIGMPQGLTLFAI